MASDQCISHAFYLYDMCRRNEELDDKAIIKRLKCRIAELETELVLMRKQYLSEQKVHFKNTYVLHA